MRPNVPSSLPSVLALGALCLCAVSPAHSTGGAASEGEPVADLGPALSRVLSAEPGESGEPGDLDLDEIPGLRIVAGCLTGQGWRSVELYGDGVGFWGERTQFRLSPERMARLLGAFRKAGFAGMPESFGRSPAGPKTPPAPEESGQPARLICQVRLAAGGEVKEVRQFDKGEVSESLKDLAYEILAAGREAAAEGLTVESLAEGLRAVADGRLDSRAFNLQVHRRFEGERRPGLTGWILRIDGRAAELQRFTASGGLEPPERHQLGRERLEAVVGALLEAEVTSLPANLWAAHYTDVRVTVLAFEKQVLARKFSGMTVATHGEKQERFTRLFNVLHELVQELDG